MNYFDNDNNSNNNVNSAVKKRRFALFALSVLCMCAAPCTLAGCTEKNDSIVMELGTEKSDIKSRDEAFDSKDADINDSEACESAVSSAVQDTEGYDEKSLADDVSEIESKTDESVINTAPQTVFVYICGAVEAPGVYEADENDRLDDIVELAGGFSADADVNYLNLARRLEDGEKIFVPTTEETERLIKSGKYNPLESAADSTGNAAALNNAKPLAASGAVGLVNINTATVSELTSISGIGESRAKAIIEYRQKNGGFARIEDIMKISGIKEGLFSKIKDKITV